MKGKRIVIVLLCFFAVGVPAVLSGCNDITSNTEPTRNEHQLVTTKSRDTVRETSLEWRERMKEAVPEPGCI